MICASVNRLFRIVSSVPLPSLGRTHVSAGAEIGGQVRREHAVSKVRRRVGHAPCTAGRTHAAILAGKSDEQLVAASRTANAGEAVAENAAAQVALELLGDEGREVAAGVAIGSFSEERGEVFADNSVQQRLFRFAVLVGEGRTERAVCRAGGSDAEASTSAC